MSCSSKVPGSQKTQRIHERHNGARRNLVFLLCCLRVNPANHSTLRLACRRTSQTSDFGRTSFDSGDKIALHMALPQSAEVNPMASTLRVTSTPSPSTQTSVALNRATLARMIDHTLLRPEATRDDVLRLCDDAMQYGFTCVCVNPAYVALAAAHVAGTRVKVAAPIAFPLGATLTAVKC